MLQVCYASDHSRRALRGLVRLVLYMSEQGGPYWSSEAGRHVDVVNGLLWGRPGDEL